MHVNKNYAMQHHCREEGGEYKEELVGRKKNSEGWGRGKERKMYICGKYVHVSRY